MTRLVTLELKDFGLTPSLTLEFQSGWTTLTGETGAGKSLLLDSLEFLFGGSLRHNSKTQSPQVIGSFLVDSDEVNQLLLEWDLPVEETLVLERRIQNSRSVYRCQGSSVTAAQVRSLKPLILEIHSQHATLNLLSSRHQLGWLDKFGGQEQSDLVEEYKKNYHELKKTQLKLQQLILQEQERERELSWLQGDLEEMESVELTLDFESELTQEYRMLNRADEVRGTLQELRDLFGRPSKGVYDQVVQAGRLVHSLHDTVKDSLSWTKTLDSIVIELDELSFGWASADDAIDSDPEHLQKCAQDLQVVHKLTRKYGPTWGDVVENYDKVRLRIEELQQNTDQVQALEFEVQRLEEQHKLLLARLTKERQSLSERFAQDVEAELRLLELDQARFWVDLSLLEVPGELGQDQVNFMFQPNPGQEPVAMSGAASGGELSRLALALQVVFSSLGSQKIIILDEVDTGLGGRAAQAVAQTMSRMAQHVQLLTVTHLAIVAALAKHHWVVAKNVGESLTVSVTEVKGDARMQEIARMLSGSLETDAAKEHARELLKLGSVDR